MSVKIEKGSALSSLSLTPLIDVIFLLLIFFLVATKFAEEERELNNVRLPVASEAVPITSRPKEVVVNIDQQGNYYVTGKMLDLDGLQAALHQAYADNPTQASVVIRGDEHCDWGAVVAAMNACEMANITDYRPTTRQAEETP